MSQRFQTSDKRSKKGDQLTQRSGNDQSNQNQASQPKLVQMSNT